MPAKPIMELSKKTADSLIAYYKATTESYNTFRGESRSRFEEIDKLYQREKDYTTEHQRARAANKYNDSSRMQNMAIPIVMPQVEAAVTFQAKTFLHRYPLFGVASDPAYIDEALQMESIIDNQAIKGGWPRHLNMSFRDGFKFNFAPVELAWEEIAGNEIVTDTENPGNPGMVKEIHWAGNILRRLDPYNTIVDHRVPPTEVYKRGEFAGYTELMHRIELKAFINSLPDVIVKAVVPAFESSIKGIQHSNYMGYYTPDINPAITGDSMKVGDINWMKWVGLSAGKSGKQIDYKDIYEVTKLYCRLLPSEFGFITPKSNTPQVYKLIIINHEHVIYAERQTNAHGYIPIFIGQPYEDGLRYQTKSLAGNSEDMQYLATSYMNSIIASRRRAISDRVLYDPLRITSANINSDNPSAKIPVKPSAYGSKISDSVYQFPYNEDQASNSMIQIQSLIALADKQIGQNQTVQGQHVKGNKSVAEFQATMEGAQGGDAMAALMWEFQVFAPMKEVIKANILQYQGGTTIYNRDAKRLVEVDPIRLRKAIMDFKVTTGAIPKEEVLNTDSFTTALQTIGSSPDIGAAFNIGPLFSYLMKSQGADISDFEKSNEQQAYEQALSVWQNTVSIALEQGQTENLPPQPLPEAYGYYPKGNTPSAESEPTEQESALGLLNLVAPTAPASAS